MFVSFGNGPVPSAEDISIAKMSKLVGQVSALLPLIAAAAKPRLATFVKYARVELIPPTPGELPEVARGFGQVIRAARTRKWKEMTVKECWLSTLVAVEIVCWFWVGECIGKGHIVGYQV